MECQRSEKSLEYKSKTSKQIEKGNLEQIDYAERQQ